MMQTPKARTNSVETPQKKSPATPRTARKLKPSGLDSDSQSSSPNTANKTPKDRSPKVVERKSLPSPMSEKKRPNKVSELESQLAQLQEDLKRAKDQLNSSESSKKRAQQEAEEAKRQLLAVSAKFEESQQQLLDLSASEDARLHELRKISQDRDRAWQSELEAVQKQHSMDSAALASAMSEIQRLKVQLERVAESDVAQTKHAESAQAEIQGLRMELTETLALVERLKTELSNCKESEAQALEAVSKIRMQLETANATAEMLRTDGIKGTEAFNSLAIELQQSKARVKSLEALVSKLREDLVSGSSKKLVDTSGDIELARENGESKEMEQLKADLSLAKLEVGQLRSALDAAEIRYQEEYIQSTLQIRSAYEQIERTKSESCKREAELEAEVQKAKAQVEELRANLMDKETELQGISEENEGLNMKIEKTQAHEIESELAVEMKKLESELGELKASLLDKERELQDVTEKNDTLKREIEKQEMDKNKANDEAVALAQVARAAEREALMKLGYLTEEADKSTRRVARVTEQLDAAQAANTELEVELRRLKVQSDQWRKAAEAATAMLSTDNGKHTERTGSLDKSYNTLSGHMGSPFSDDPDDDSPKKRNGNMLKKIGVLWKKGQK